MSHKTLKKLAIFLMILSTLAMCGTMAFAEKKLPWNGKEISGWVCNGKELKPKSGASAKNTWVFNGWEIKLKSGATAKNTWLWDGYELKRKSGTTASDTWVVSDGKVKPKSGANSNNTWAVGDAPILVIAGKVAMRLY